MCLILVLMGCDVSHIGVDGILCLILVLMGCYVSHIGVAGM